MGELYDWALVTFEHDEHEDESLLWAVSAGLSAIVLDLHEREIAEEDVSIALLFFAEPIDADHALRLGLLNLVVPAATLAAQTRELASRVAAGPLVSYRYMKANVNLATTVDFRTMLDREPETHLRCGQTEDHREGVKAFLEKRAPKFQGR